ncbi:fumarylacetoacetate hydrolase family protein [Actinoplanes sp. NPDC051411]|uniref:fumarylacetoacetate hydrolase family protein n=1 Tax=Actinoplanes sp. NPDC051411 TaxID=3155522 RepID=UPI00342BDB1E
MSARAPTRLTSSPTFTLGKSFDTHGPIGPWLTTDDEIADPHALRMRLTVDGEERQNWTTDDMIYNIWEQIAELTTVMTLMPGDILATGTPAGIGAPTGRWLRPGDVVRAEIAVTGRDPQTREMPDALESQCANMFRAVREIVAAAGATTGDIAKMTVWLRDYRDREALNREWTARFPDPDDRPARQAVAATFDGNALVQCDFVAVLGFQEIRR